MCTSLSETDGDCFPVLKILHLFLLALSQYKVAVPSAYNLHHLIHKRFVFLYSFPLVFEPDHAHVLVELESTGFAKSTYCNRLLKNKRNATAYHILLKILHIQFFDNLYYVFFRLHLLPEYRKPYHNSNDMFRIHPVQHFVWFPSATAYHLQ